MSTRVRRHTWLRSASEFATTARTGTKRSRRFADNGATETTRPENVAVARPRRGAHFVTDSTRDVALVDAELELQRVGATHHREHVTRLGARSHAFVGPRVSYDALNG